MWKGLSVVEGVVEVMVCEGIHQVVREGPLVPVVGVV